MHPVNATTDWQIWWQIWCNLSSRKDFYGLCLFVPKNSLGVGGLKIPACRDFTSVHDHNSYRSEIIRPISNFGPPAHARAERTWTLIAQIPRRWPTRTKRSEASRSSNHRILKIGDLMRLNGWAEISIFMSSTWGWLMGCGCSVFWC